LTFYEKNAGMPATKTYDNIVVDRNHIFSTCSEIDKIYSEKHARALQLRN